MFPLKQRTLIRGALAHEKAGLGAAADYVADKDNLYLPFDGTITTYFGNQGGNWLRLNRADNGDQIEFAHLERFILTSGTHKAGELCAITDNTGEITTGPHLHIQIFRKGVRLDPETYDWGFWPLNYVQRVQSHGEVYKIENGKAVFIDSHVDSTGHNPLIDTVLKELTNEGRLKGISEDDFHKLYG